ncbi:response regulator [Pseudoalteromonas sp. Hal099]
MRILAVEDDEVLGEAICQRFTKMGQGIDLVTSGDVANSLLKRHEYDLILLDLNLPNLNGEQILKKLVSLIKYACINFNGTRSSRAPYRILT